MSMLADARAAALRLFRKTWWGARLKRENAAPADPSRAWKLTGVLVSEYGAQYVFDDDLNEAFADFHEYVPRSSVWAEDDAYCVVADSGKRLVMQATYYRIQRAGEVRREMQTFVLLDGTEDGA